MQDALKYAQQGVLMYGDRRNSTWPLKFRLLTAEILLTQERPSDARSLLDNLPADPAPSDELKARLLMDSAELRAQSGQPAEALALLGQALALASKAGAPSLQAWIELKRGVIADDFDKADAAFHRALDLATGQRDEFFAAMALNNLGYIRLRRFRYDEAIPWFEEADRTAQRIPSKVTHEQALGNLAWCYFRLGQWNRALDLFSKAEALAAGARMTGDQQRWLGNIGNIYFAREALDKAIAYYLQARDIAQHLGDRLDEANWLNNITRAYVVKSDWSAAEKFNRMALDALDGTVDAQWVAAYSRLNAGFIAAARGRTDDAEAEFRAAMPLAQAGHQPNVSWQAHSGLAELYAAQSRNEVAGREYAAAIELLDREWLALSRDESKITFRGYLASVYQDYVGFLAEQGRKEKALEVAESSRARLLMQKLEGKTGVLPAFHASDAIRLARETECVLLSYWLAPKRSYMWAVTPRGIWQFILPGEPEINTLIEQHRRSIENLQDPLALGSPAALRLYSTLVGPLERLLPKAARVVVVPDGRLHDVNFETLVVEGAKPHYWIEDATVVLAPSLGVLRSRAAVPVRKTRLLIIGDPLPADPEFPPLPHLKTEIQEITADFAESERAVYAGADAYAERFREANPGAFTAIHFAAHASANEESPLNSAIVLSLHGGRYKLYASEVADLHLAPELVTISACRSAGSKAYSGEGLIGFAWAFLDAGAHNVVAGIWNVDDAAAPLLMREFYKEWRQGGDAAASLRIAKLRLIGTGGVFRKPYYWGPFQVFATQATRSAMDLAWRNRSR
jgi:CHAT domain-containing protein/Tfp pilus assembly protein PilF